MSMSTSPFGSPAEAAPPAAASPADEVAADSSRRNLLILAGVAAALVLGAAVYFLLLRGGDDPDLAAGPVNPLRPRVTASAPPTIEPPIKKYVAAKARNPFIPLISPPVAAAAPVSGTGVVGGTTGGTTGGTGGTTGGTGGTTGGTGGTTGGNGGGTGGTGTSPGNGNNPVYTPPAYTPPAYTPPATTPNPAATAVPATPHKVTLVSVASGDTSAQIRVDGKTTTVKPLEKFGETFKLLNLRDSTCGAIQHGDVVFDLCEGKSRIVP